MIQKKVLLFDMDGVLVNTEPIHYRAWRQALLDFGKDLDYDIYKLNFIGATFDKCYQTLVDTWGSVPVSPEELCKVTDEGKKELYRIGGVPAIDGVPETLKLLYEKGYRMAVASSSPQSFIEHHMERIGTKRYFELLFSAEKVKRSKPAPDVFLAAAAAMNAEPEDCIVVEDSNNGTRAAKAAGMFCVGFDNPDSGGQDISCADVIIHHFSELAEVLERITKDRL